MLSLSIFGSHRHKNIRESLLRTVYTFGLFDTYKGRCVPLRGIHRPYRFLSGKDNAQSRGTACSSQAGEGACLIRAAMSVLLHAVVRGPSLTGLGNLPSLHPRHHALLLTGISSRTCGRRSKESPAGYVMAFLLLFQHVSLHWRAFSLKSSRKSDHVCIILRRSGRYCAWL